MLIGKTNLKFDTFIVSKSYKMQRSEKKILVQFIITNFLKVWNETLPDGCLRVTDGIFMTPAIYG